MLDPQLRSPVEVSGATGGRRRPHATEIADATIYRINVALEQRSAETAMPAQRFKYTVCRGLPRSVFADCPRRVWGEGDCPHVGGALFMIRSPPRRR